MVGQQVDLDLVCGGCRITGRGGERSIHVPDAGATPWLVIIDALKSVRCCEVLPRYREGWAFMALGKFCWGWPNGEVCRRTGHLGKC